MPRPPNPLGKFCVAKIDDQGHECGKKVLAKGLCKTHYYRKKRDYPGGVDGPIRASLHDPVQLSPERLEREVAEEIEAAAQAANLSTYEFRRRHWNEWYAARKNPAAAAKGQSVAPLKVCVDLAAKWATRVSAELRAEIMSDFLSLAQDPPTAPSANGGGAVVALRSGGKAGK